MARLKAVNQKARRVDQQTLDPALESGRDGALQALIDLNRSDCAHGLGKFARRHGFGFHAELLHPVQADLQLRPGRFLAFVHGDVIHAHRILLGHGRGVW